MDAAAFGQPLDTTNIPEDFMPMEAVCIVKGIDSSGTIKYFECATKGLGTHEALGMVITCGDTLRKALMREVD